MKSTKTPWHRSTGSNWWSTPRTASINHPSSSVIGQENSKLKSSMSSPMWRHSNKLIPKHSMIWCTNPRTPSRKQKKWRISTLPLLYRRRIRGTLVNVTVVLKQQESSMSTPSSRRNEITQCSRNETTQHLRTHTYLMSNRRPALPTPQIYAKSCPENHNQTRDVKSDTILSQHKEFRDIRTSGRGNQWWRKIHTIRRQWHLWGKEASWRVRLIANLRQRNLS